MESLITAPARALEAGDPLGALNRVALRDGAPALAPRGVATVQHGRFPERDRSCLVSRRFFHELTSSRHRHAAGAVRYAPIATKFRSATKCRDGP